MLSGRVPPLDALTVLLAVAEHGSLGAAARAVGLTQPTVSARIQSMERQVGFAVVERGPRGSRLTPAGAAFAEQAQAVVDAAAALDAGIAALRADARARLRVAASQTLAELLNGIFPGFVTMGLFGIVYLMLKKKMNPLLIMLVILLVSIAGAFFGVLGVQ